jgi:hypothetical protein
MGAFGDTPQASMSTSTAGNKADLNCDGSVNFRDVSILTKNWKTEEYLLPEDIDRDGDVDFADVGLFAQEWLKQ